MLKFSLQKIITILFLLYIRIAKLAASNAPGARIVGGQITTINQVPYLMQIRINDEFMCGGTLVSNNQVITAAHCVKGVSARSVSVVGGTTFLSERGIRRGVSKIYLPKAFQPNSLYMDVALLKLSGSMTGSKISTIGLCNSKLSSGQIAKVSGWGHTSENRSKLSNQVRTVSVSLISKAKCTQMYRSRASLTKTMFCTFDQGSKDACSGDSGGPLVYNERLCGIVSWGLGCARARYPGVYTNVNIVSSFISTAMQK